MWSNSRMQRPTLSIGALIALATGVASTSLGVLTTSSSGAFSFKLGNTTYYSPPSVVSKTCFSLDAGFSGPEVLPLTVLKTNETTITAGILTTLVQQYDSIDDVWSVDFLGGALVISAPEGAVLSASGSSWIVSHGIQYLLPTETMDIKSFNSSGISVFFNSDWGLKPGPYTFSLDVSGVTIREAYRLYRDNYEAFVFGTTPAYGSSAYEAVELFIPSYQDAWIPVPSRLYSLDDTRPLAGKRIALKDIYDLEGVQTGGGSRSYAEVFTIANKTAVSATKLINMGATIVGKTKTSQFAHGADPWQFLDIHYPFNPRGDGWLTAASSSAGSAAAIAGYEWIDFALGSDTRGSVRKPAAMVGSYGIRPTWNSQDLTGILPLAHELDTAGFFARDPELFYKISKLWYHDSPVPVNKTFTSFPKKLIYPVDYFPVANPEAQALYDGFVSVLERSFGMVKTPTNISDILRTSTTPQVNNFTAFQLNSNRLAEYISYKEIGIPVEKAWNTKFPGAGYPPFDPNPRAAFARSVNLTSKDYDDAVKIKYQFRDFFLENVMKPCNDTCSDGILIIDIGTGGLPSYREQALNSQAGATALSITVPNGGLANNYLASTAGCPEIGIPIGQVGYKSYISLQMEMMPVSVDLIAYPGCDAMLLELVKELAAKGVAKTVKVGRTAF